MSVQLASWVGTAVCVVVAAAIFGWQQRRITVLRDEVRSADERLALLAHIAPPLTQAAQESTPRTCERIVERLVVLVRVRTALCFVESAGHLIVGAAAADGEARFLRVGDLYEGDGIVEWARRNRHAAVVGPAVAQLPPELPIVDISTVCTSPKPGPLAGSRDRVWALAIPMTNPQALGTPPENIGIIYMERPHSEPFSEYDLQTACTIARSGGDALQRSIFADDVKKEAKIDQLTQLLTAATFRKRLRDEIEAHKRDRHRDVALFFIDTDRFKMWNDTFGHAVGDALLKQLAQMFREVAATGGFAGRNGGDEFCIALLDRTKDDAVTVAEGLRDRVERAEFVMGPQRVPQPRIPITISIGVAHFPVDVGAAVNSPADRLLEVADAQMYEAKRDGRNRVAFSRARQQTKA